MPRRSRKTLPKGSNPLARSAVDAAIASADQEGADPNPPPGAVYDEPDIPPEPPKDPGAVGVEKRGSAKGGRARAKAPSADERAASAKKAADARRKRT